MKKIIIFLTFIFSLSHFVYAVGFSGNFSQAGGSVYDGGDDDNARGVAVDTITAGGPYIFVVGFSSNGVAQKDYFTIKYDASGVMLASATFDGGSIDEGNGIALDNSGNVYVIGSSSNGVSNYDYVTLKYNNNLVFLSSAVFNSGSSDKGYGIATDNFGNVYVTGGNDDYITIKYDSNLVFQSSTVFTALVAYGRSIAADNQGNVYVTGYAFNANYDCVTIKYNSALVFQSSAVFNGGSNDYGRGIAADNSGNVYVTGYSYNATNPDYVTIKYNSALVFQSSAVVDSGSNDMGYSVAVDTTGNVYVTGEFNNDYVTIKYNSALVFQSSATYNNGSVEESYGIAVDNTGNVYVTGESYTSPNYNFRTIRYLPSKFPDAPPPNNAPTLSWTGETNYISDGLDPETGYSTTTFIYRVTYTDTDNDAPASGYPKVHIKKGGSEISGSPFTMSAADSNAYNVGRKYTYSTTLSTGTDYTYYFEAQDINGATATGTPTIAKDAPDVSTGVVTTYYIKGYVKDNGGTWITGVTMNLTVATVKVAATISTGYYEFLNLSTGSYTVTPSKSGWSFNPKSKSYSPLSANQDDQNFSCIAVEFPGEIKIIGGTESKGTVNPDKGENVKIDFKGTEVGKFECRIFTLTGELVYQETKENISEGRFEWTPKDIASGVYVVYIKGPGVKVHKKMAILR